jgi:type VI secretion system VgrG family protein
MPEKCFSFISRGLDPETFGVIQFSGVEGISLPYEFDITLVSDNPDIDLDKVISAPAHFTIHRKNGEDVDFHGMLNTFEQLHKHNEYIFYRAHLVPRMWWLSITHHNQVSLKKNVLTIVELALKDAGLSTLDFQFKTKNQYRELDYVCQFNESHFNFISRWLEREGIYYYFDQSGTVEKIIFTDTHIAHTALPNVQYIPPSGLLDDEQSELVHSFICRQKQLPQKIYLKDYNYERPSLGISGSANVDQNGRGTDYIYGDFFPDSNEGNRLAAIRAEILNCRKREFIGESTVPFLKPGYLFTLKGHYRDDFNQQYLVESVSHEGNQVGYLLPDISNGLPHHKNTIYYRNSFTTIPSSVQYRAERKALRPHISGTLHASIDAEGSGQYAELDGQGRYKVRLPFDENDTHANGKASTYLRMMQPYANRKGGMQFPLTKGTEVLLTFIDGDPDRPVIAGAVSNPETPSPVTSKNQTEAVIQTGGNNKIRIEDKKGNERIIMESPTANSWVRIGAPNDPPDPYQILSAKTVNDILTYTDDNGTWTLVNYDNAPLTDSIKTQKAEDNKALTYQLTANLKIRNAGGAAVLLYENNGLQISSGNGQHEHLKADVAIVQNTTTLSDYYNTSKGRSTNKVPYLSNNNYSLSRSAENVSAEFASAQQTSTYSIHRNSKQEVITTGKDNNDTAITNTRITVNTDLLTTITSINGTSGWQTSTSINCTLGDNEESSVITFYREKTVTLQEIKMKTYGGEDDGIRIYSSKHLWIESNEKYAEYRTGVRTDAPVSNNENDPKIGDLFKHFGSSYKPNNLQKRHSEDSRFPDGETPDFDDFLKNAHVVVSSLDTFKTQEGNIYDFGGYWNYNMGNSYEEKFMKQNGIELNNSSWPNDKTKKGGPNPGEISSQHLGKLDNDTWISKTIEGANYSYTNGTKSLEVENNTRSETHTYGKKSYDYTHGGRTEETKYTGDGVKVSHSWSEKSQSVEESYDPTTSFLISYEFKNQKHFTYEAQLPNYPRLKISTCSSAILDTTITVALNQKIDLTLAGNFNIDITTGGGLGLDLDLRKGGVFKLDPSNSLKFEGIGFTARKKALLDIKKSTAEMNATEAKIEMSKLRLNRLMFELKSKNIGIDQGFVFNGL